VAVVVVGVEEGEFRDRSKLSLPGHQDALVRAVSATGVPTVVVIVGGSAITMPWLDEVDAVLMAWYPGEQGGPAIADVLFGDASPSGRLPITFPQREGQLPLTYDHKPTGRGDDYLDGSGAPLFPFGHGLSYTTFAWDSLHVTTVNDRAGDDVRVQISARIRNTGPRAGHEVVQLYVRDEVTSVAQPLIALRGAARVALEPGASTRVAFTLGARELALLDRDLRWRVEPGTFRVMLGASSRDIRLRDIFTLR
jgi:beta-glucosidase